jgi:Tfp pilus assembly ATPase PilU
MAKLTLVALLRAMVDQDASDLHITAGSPPQFRISGKLIKAKTPSLLGFKTSPVFEEIYFINAQTWERSFVKFRPSFPNSIT